MAVEPLGWSTAIFRWSARLVLAGAVLAAVQGGWTAALESRLRVLNALEFRSETIDASLDRLYGARYMQSVRKVRESIPVDSTVYFIDQQPREQGADYLALHLLAPRRLQRIGQARLESIRPMRRRLPATAEQVVVIGALGEPLVLVPADEIRRLRHDGR
jgi:hypothetical protein